MKENVISLSQDISNNAVVYFSEPVVVTKKNAYQRAGEDIRHTAILTKSFPCASSLALI